MCEPALCGRVRAPGPTSNAPKPTICYILIYYHLLHFPFSPVSTIITALLHYLLQGCLVLVGKDIELNAVGRQFWPYLTAGCVCTLEAHLWCDLGCCPRTVVVMKAAANPCFYK